MNTLRRFIALFSKSPSINKEAFASQPCFSLKKKQQLSKKKILLDDTPEVSSVALDTVFNAKFNINLDNEVVTKYWKYWPDSTYTCTMKLNNVNFLMIWSRLLLSSDPCWPSLPYLWSQCAWRHPQLRHLRHFEKRSVFLECPWIKSKVFIKDKEKHVHMLVNQQINKCHPIVSNWTDNIYQG